MFYETIDDITADAGIRIRASSIEELICKAIIATFNEITDIEDINVETEHTVEVSSPLPYALADIINEALVIHETENFIAKECTLLEFNENRIKVLLKGGRFDPERHKSKLVIKAATYHRLKVEKVNGEYIGEIIFDI